MSPTFDLLSVDRGAVVAPAGCGKTHSIVDAVHRHKGKPILVLTHTNAGVCALRSRLTKVRTAASSYRVATLDGWALRVVLAYPNLAGLRPDTAAINYPSLRDAVIRAIKSGALDAVLRATYGRIFVDEYQDCSDQQHRLVLALAARLPCCVLGDPLQRIFDFAGAMPDWDGEVLVDFPLVGELDYPHRWVNAREEAFGQWVLDVRPGLIRGAGVDLTRAPANLRWIKVAAPAARPRAEQQAMAGFAATDETLLIVGNPRDRNSRAEFALRHDGVGVVEPVDLPDMMPLAAAIGQATGQQRLRDALTFANTVMTGLGPAFKVRIDNLAAGWLNDPNVAESACLDMLGNSSWKTLATMLEAVTKVPNARVFRPDLMSVMVDGARRADAEGGDLLRSVLAVREARRTSGRQLPLRGVGSTLLLKGLEADHALVLDGGDMNARHLYVAISRACRSLTILSELSVLGR